MKRSSDVKQLPKNASKVSVRPYYPLPKEDNPYEVSSMHTSEKNKPLAINDIMGRKDSELWPSDGSDEERSSVKNKQNG